MDTTTLQEEYDLYIQDGRFRNKFQHLLTPEFLDWWFKVLPTPQEAGYSQKEYFERMSWMLVGWLGKQKFLKDDYMEELIRELETKLGYTVEVVFKDETVTIRSGENRPKEQKPFTETFESKDKALEWLTSTIKDKE